jgi:hypothetical protein
MPLYRVTIRYGARAQRYHVEDVRADSLKDAVRAVANAFPQTVTDADLIEVRLQVNPEARAFGPE